MAITVTEEEKEIGLTLLRTIAYDNGFFNRFNPEHFPDKWVQRVGKIAKVFFDNNPELLNDDDIENICTGEYSEVHDKYDRYEGFAELDTALDEYFNNH